MVSYIWEINRYIIIKDGEIMEMGIKIILFNINIKDRGI